MTESFPLPYPRNMVGYTGNPPSVPWPRQARIAVQFVLNYEEGAENSILHQDKASEAFISEMIGAQPILGARAMAMESLYEYGSRAGFWRLHDIFVRHQAPLTVFGVAMAMQRNPAAVEAMLKANWEIATHGLRWIDYQHIPEEVEYEHIQRCIALHTQLTGHRPLGWYQGRTSPNTARLVVKEGGFIYDADSYADDIPYYDTRYGKAQLIVPYTLDANDMRFAALNGFTEGQQFLSYLKDTFDQLYEESLYGSPRMMSIGLHCRIAGKPGRARAVARFLDYIQQKDHVWIATRLDIARHWLKACPPPQPPSS